MFFKKNYFVEFEYEGAKGKATCSATVRCIPSMVPEIPNELKKILIGMGHKIDTVFITSIKKI
ncbi:hypothetical protein U728_766 [Clostridium botulinum 202F]|nr:hypothetical protein U728_766 [Clostridium botulinum 202F]KON14712.1 hypothetical protein ACP50_00755 [Clostridium botulinum]MBY6988466.1 hypothetical protein [Clostridium botulinum]NFH01686.1 hypothetical protein [Clostridium botulinum]NFP41036.1 hypothetical protein [Clostridium botulinum]